MAILGVGKFVVKGVQGNVAYTGVVSVSMSSDNTKLMGASLRNEFGVTEHRDGVSNVFSVTADEPIHRLSIRFVPTATTATPTLANAKANVVLPERLATVTLAGFGNTNIDGAWFYVGGSIDYSPDSPVELSMELTRYGTDPTANAITTNPAVAFNQ
jgi:hypothetical protein